ncbi:hypothetical protein DSAG12_03152 [Promethearchaeum syntrophicum]|uniref:Uncharacterized protein n=1 Tax=Promethearchaeum syntrophicum TaxID=2594042 RepID=A0A5B9DDC8_9ARCH|nr:hypothetical protein [Candidatus Prometheoarchaeum syntrophicum]QEE17319.1 hypothetical protein DSAG12_03152 [Candidatus Prometheoarchaeum syntrophicum]
MVVTITIFQFELNQDETGDIEPEFKNLVSEMPGTGTEKEKIDLNDLITENDKYRLFYNHTTGLDFKKRERMIKNFILGRLKETPYRVLSYYHHSIDESQYLILALFALDDDVELYEGVFYQMCEKLGKIFNKLAKSSKTAQVLREVEREMLNQVKFALFQIERLSNLTKIQKIALIFSSYERMMTLKLLKEGPLSRIKLRSLIDRVKKNPNMDIILKPFLEMNIVRRDWARGVHSKDTGRVHGEGEYLFLLKDLSLIRIPPKELMADMKKHEIHKQYFEELNNYYATYDPFTDLYGESEKLAKIILDPDIFDLLALLNTKAYPVKKLPNVLSNFAQLDDVLKKLLEVGIVKLIKDGEGRNWICVMAEISFLSTFPEFLLPKIKDRSSLRWGAIDETSLVSPITKEIAQIALELLENTYWEKVGV